MLSYRHAFHAGNHADVLKHLVLVCVLDHMLAKQDKPLVFLDTHAGPGGCDLREAMASKNAEFEAGIGRLWENDKLSEPLARYVGLVRSFNPDGALVHYPGSPAIARCLMLDRIKGENGGPEGPPYAKPERQSARRLELCELHPDDHRRLTEWAGRERRIQVHREDGFSRLKALLPPVERRALVLIDPPYEVKDDYRTVTTALRDALNRFATGVYVLWYPLLERHDVTALRRRLDALPGKRLHVELEVVPRTAPGMYGSGLLVLNPPWQLQAQLEACQGALEETLCGVGAKGLSIAADQGVA